MHVKAALLIDTLRMIKVRNRNWFVKYERANGNCSSSLGAPYAAAAQELMSSDPAS